MRRQFRKKRRLSVFLPLAPQLIPDIRPFCRLHQGHEIADRIQNLIAITGGSEISDPFVAFCWGLIHAAADLLLITNEKVTPKRIGGAAAKHTGAS